MTAWKVAPLALIGFVGCSSNGSDTGGADAGQGGLQEASVGDDGGAADATPQGDAGPTTTIATARGGNVTTPITVTAVVTAVRGDDPVDTKEWYIEDPTGGPSSGIAVYCDHAAKQAPCPAGITAPALHDLVTVTGTIVPYQGKLEIAPTAQSTVMSNAPAPPVPTVTPADLAPSGSSNLRGTVVKLATKVTVDDPTPHAFYYSKCAMGDGGAGPDGGPTLCSGCAPPTYLGFQVTDGSGNEILIENHFYTSEHLQSSPECLTHMGAVPVTRGMTFSGIAGILELNPSSMMQTFAPVLDSDYTTP
jgi:hypothetical protein